MNSHPSDSDASAPAPESTPTPAPPPAAPPTATAPPPYTPQPPSAPAAPVDLFDKIRALGAVRPDEGRWFAGVAAGLARRWGVDPLLVRGGFVALSLVFGIGLFVYGVCWLVLPHPDGRIHAQEVTRGTVTAGFIGAVLATLAGMPFGNAWGHSGPGWAGGSGLVSVILVGALIWWLARRRGAGRAAGASTSWTAGTTPSAPWPASTVSPVSPASPAAGSSATSATSATYEAPSGAWPAAGSGAEEYGPTGHVPPGVPTASSAGYAPAASPTPRSATRPWRPLTLVTLGAAVLIGVLADQLAHNAAVTAASALSVVGLGLLIAGLAGRRGGFLVPVAVILALTSLAGTASTNDSSTPDRFWRPTTVPQAVDGFRTGGASTQIDLTSEQLLTAARAGALTIPIDQGAGELRVVLPAGVPARVEATVGLGEIRDLVGSHTEQGVGLDRTVKNSAPGSPIITVRVSLGAGRLVVSQATSSPATSLSPSPAAVPSPVLSSIPVPSRS